VTNVLKGSLGNLSYTMNEKSYRILGYGAGMKDCLEELGTEDSIMLKWILKKETV